MRSAKGFVYTNGIAGYNQSAVVVAQRVFSYVGTEDALKTIEKHDSVYSFSRLYIFFQVPAGKDLICN